LLLNKKEKEVLVLKLANEGLTTRQIAKEVRISLRTIGKILNKATGDDVAANEEVKKQKRLKELSPYAQAFQMFQLKKPLTDVAIELDIDTNTVLYYYKDYLRLVNMRRLVTVYQELKDDLPLFIHLYRRIKKEKLAKQDVTDIIEYQRQLKHLDKKVDFYNNHIESLIKRIVKLENKHEELTRM
jgi:transposase